MPERSGFFYSFVEKVDSGGKPVENGHAVAPFLIIMAEPQE